MNTSTLRLECKMYVVNSYRVHDRFGKVLNQTASTNIEDGGLILSLL